MKKFFTSFICSILLIVEISNANTIKVSNAKAVLVHPDNTIKVLKILNSGEELEVISTEGNYYKVKYNDTIGMIHKNFISSNSNLTTIANKPKHEYKLNGTVRAKYEDETISVSIEKLDSTFTITKIWLSDPGKQIRKQHAPTGTVKRFDKIMDPVPNAIVAVNASPYWGRGTGSYPADKYRYLFASSSEYTIPTTAGLILVTNGVCERDKGPLYDDNNMNYMAIKEDGTFIGYEHYLPTYAEVKEAGVYNTIIGFYLLKDGEVRNRYLERKYKFEDPARRTAIGQVDENNYILISTTSGGYYAKLQDIGLQLDCKNLFNTDGGSSRNLWFRGALSGTGIRIMKTDSKISEALYFKSLKGE